MDAERLERIREMSVGTEQSYGVFALAEAYEAASAGRDTAWKMVEELRGHIAARDAECAKWQGELAACRQEVERLKLENSEFREQLSNATWMLQNREKEWQAAADATCATLRERAEKAEASLADMKAWSMKSTFMAEADRERLLGMESRAEKAEAERDAYKRAKAENDERFMVERDQARAECERLKGVLRDLFEADAHAPIGYTPNQSRAMDKAKAILHP